MLHALHQQERGAAVSRKRWEQKGGERELTPRGRLSVASGLCLGLISIASEINANASAQHTHTHPLISKFMWLTNPKPCGIPTH